MIIAKIISTPSGEITGFDVDNHGETHVCAAVSAMVINTVNSIEILCDDKISYEYSPDGGHIEFSLDAPERVSMEARVLLASMVIGLASIQEQHPNDLTIQEVIL